MSPEITALLDRSDDVIGGVWGNHITWSSDNWDEMEPGKSQHRAYGHKPHHNREGCREGALIAAEFTHSWILFKVTKCRSERDPPDMVFLTMTPIEQVMKPAIPPATAPMAQE